MAYSKQTWDTTSYVNPTRMNHIEDGIEAADSKTADDIPYSTGVSVKDKIDDMLGGIVQYKDYTLSQALTIGAGEAKVASLTENLPLTTISAVIWNYNTSGFDNLIPTPNKWYSSIRIMIKNTGSTSATIPVTTSIRVYYI